MVVVISRDTLAFYGLRTVGSLPAVPFAGLFRLHTVWFFCGFCSRFALAGSHSFFPLPTHCCVRLAFTHVTFTQPLPPQHHIPTHTLPHTCTTLRYVAVYLGSTHRFHTGWVVGFTGLRYPHLHLRCRMVTCSGSLWFYIDVTHYGSRCVPIPTTYGLPCVPDSPRTFTFTHPRLLLYPAVWLLPLRLVLGWLLRWMTFVPLPWFTHYPHLVTFDLPFIPPCCLPRVYLPTFFAYHRLPRLLFARGLHAFGFVAGVVTLNIRTYVLWFTGSVRFGFFGFYWSIFW